MIEITNKDINNQFSSSEKEKKGFIQKTKSEKSWEGLCVLPKFLKCSTTFLNISKNQSDFIVLFCLKENLFGLRIN